MMREEPEGAVVLTSGGVDSTTLLFYVAETLGRRPVYTLSFAYGQRHARELACAERQARAVGVAEHRVVDLPDLGALVEGVTALAAGGLDVPDLADLDEEALEQPPTYVPNRNMILLALAAAYAEARGERDVFYGAQAHDEYGYWDCTPDFVARLNEVFELNRRTPVAVHAPFAGKSKGETVKIGLALGVDYAHTWSCYRGGDLACGTCPTCVERLRAFEEAGVADPIAYARA